MKTIDQKKALEVKIAYLKSKQANDFILLKEQYYITIDSFKTINLIRSSLEKLIVSPSLKSDLINHVISFSTNYLAKNIFDDTKNPIKKVVIKVLKFALRKFIEKKR